MIAPFFDVARRNVSEHAHQYVAGLLSHCPRKNVERICEVLPGTRFENLQYFLSESPWEAAPLWKWIGLRAASILGGGEDNMLLLDESCFTKKGDKSAGVKRQYNGRLGKLDNCQVGVFSALTCGDRVALAGARLYLPEDWVEDPQRCKAAAIPESERRFRTKPELAWELVEQAHADGVAFGWVGMDAVYGRDYGLLLKISRMGKTFVADVNHDQLAWTQEPVGPARPKAVGESGGQRVDALWEKGRKTATQVTLRDGENGPVRVLFWSQRAWIWPAGSETALGVWLCVTERADGTVKYSFCNAGEGTSPEELARRQGQRYFVERAFEDAKSHLGMGQYQARRWRAWVHHMVLVGLAMVFTLEERERVRSETPLTSVRDVVDLIAWYFEKDRTGVEVEEAIRARHKRREQAMISKRRKALQKSDVLTM